LEKIKIKIAPFKNTLVIAYFGTVCRLVDAIEDESDGECCYVLDKGNALEFPSVLIKIIPLKGYIDDNDYADLVKVWNLNNFDKAE
jgi:hypothetical protein